MMAGAGCGVWIGCLPTAALARLHCYDDGYTARATHRHNSSRTQPDLDVAGTGVACKEAPEVALVAALAGQFEFSSVL